MTEPTPAEDSPSALPAWRDGDRLLEALAAAVWTHCHRHGDEPAVCDDPRNIAVAVAPVIEAHTAQLRETADAVRLERAMWWQNATKAEAALARIRAAADQLHHAHINADGQPLTPRDKGVIHAVTRIHDALNQQKDT